MTQNEKDCIFGKRWYAVKVFYGAPGESKSTDFICEETSLPDNHPYLFYMDINHSGRIETDQRSIFNKPRRARIERGKLVMYSSDNGNGKFEFEIIRVSPDFLQIKDEEETIYFFDFR